MGKHFNKFKRCVSMVLTVAMLLSICNLSLVMSVTAAGGGVGDSYKFTTLGRVMADNYDLSAAEKVIISSDNLSAEEIIYYEAPPAQSNDENKLITVDEDNKKVTVKSFKDTDGNKWIPKSFDLVANGAVADGHDDLALVKDGSSYVGTYAYADNTFSINVKYVLESENLNNPIDADSQLAMLNAAAKLAEDIRFMEILDKDTFASLYGVDVDPVGLLTNLTVKLPQLDNESVIDLIYSLVEGISETVTLPDGSTENITVKLRPDGKAAAESLYAQQNNGGLDLVKLFNKSYLEILNEYSAEFEAALNKNYSEIKEIAGRNGLDRITSDIEDLLSDIDDWTYGAINDKLDDYESYVGNVTVSKASDLNTVIAKLEEAKGKLFDKVDEHMTANASTISLLSSLSGISIPTTSVEDEDDLANLIAKIKSAISAASTLLSMAGQLNAANEAVAGLESVQSAINTINDTIDTLNSSIPVLETIDAKKAELQEKNDMLGMLVEILNDFCDTVEPVVENTVWNTKDVLADNGIDSNEYISLTQNATGITDTYEEGDVIENLLIDTAFVQYNVSMFNVTIKVNASIVSDAVDSDALVALQTFEKTEPFRLNTTAAELEALIEDYVNEALAAWGVIDLNNYDRINAKELDALLTDGKLTDDIIYKVEFVPKNITVTYGDGFDTDSAEYPYGYQLTLPKHETEGMAYSYLVDGERFNQGKVITITKDIEISRSEGEANQYKSVVDLILNTGIVSDEVESFLQSLAIDKGDKFWLVAPNDESLIDQTKLFIDSTVSAEKVDAELGDLVWVPVVAITYDEDGNEIETADFNGTVAEIIDRSYATIKVQYSLELTEDALASVDVDIETVLDKMNLQKTLAEQYISQKAALEQLLTQRGRMSQISQYSGALSALNCGPEAKAAINKVLAQLDEVEAATGEENLKLYYLLTLCDTNGDGKVDNMSAYYQHADEFIEEVEFMLGLVDVIKNDASLWSTIVSMEYDGTFEELEAKFKDIDLIPAHDDIITEDNVALDNLVSKIAAAAENLAGLDVYDAEDLENLVWNAYITTAGVGSVQIPITLTVGNNVLKDTITLKIDNNITDENISAVEAKLHALEEKYANLYGAIDKIHYDSEAVLLNVGDKVTGNEAVSVVWTAKTYTVIIDGVGTYEITYDIPSVTLPGTGNSNLRYDYFYTYGADVTVIQPVSVKDQVYSFNKAEFDAIFASGSITISREVIDTTKEDLIAFVDGMKGAAVLAENNGKYAVVLPLSLNTNALKDSMSKFAVGLVMGGYQYIGIDGNMLYGADSEGNSQYHIQALVDAVLNSGIGTESFIELINADGSVKQLVLDGYNVIGAYDKAKLGGQLIKTTMTFGSTADDAVAVDFYVTLNEANDTLVKLESLLVKLRPYVSVVCEDGMLNAVVNLPDQVYAAYLAALTMVGEVDIHDIESVNAKVALGYLLTLADPILNDEDVTLETFTNTIEKFNYNLDLSDYEKIYATVLKYYDSDAVEYDDDTCIVPVEDVDINFVLNRLQPMVDQMMSGFDLSSYIYEAKAGIDFKLAVTLTNIEKDYAALVIDARASGIANKIAMLTSDELVAKVPELSGVSAVVLFGDINGNLVFNTKTLLDLNGFNVNGNIVANDTLIITDNVIDNASSGCVTGKVSGKATIVAGKYASDVSAFLKSGYVQNADGLVYNKFYTLVADGNDITITFNATVADMKEFLSKNSLIALAIDAGVDVALNYYNTASLCIEGKQMFNVQIEDIIDLVAGTDRVNNAIDKALASIYVSDLAELINIIVADITDFAALETALNGDGTVANYKIETAPWELSFERVDADNSLTVNLGASDDKDEGSLSIVIAGELKDDFAVLAGALADTVKVESNLDLDDIVRDGKDFVINGSYEGSVVIDFTHDRSYVVMMAVVLADNSDEELKAELVAALEDYYATNSLMKLEKVFNKLSVKDVCDALANVKRTDKFSDMVNALALSDAIKAKINGVIGNDAKGYARVIEVAGIVLRELESRELLESVTESGRQLGGIAKTDAEGNRYYGFSADKTIDINRDIFRGYGIDATLDITNVEFRLYLFGDAADHEYKVEYNWAADYSACEIVLTCIHCVNDHVVTLDAEVSADPTPATCTEGGYTVYTARAEYDGVDYEDSITVDTDAALGHDYVPTFDWSSDVVTVDFVCSRCGDAVNDVVATVSIDYTAPGCVTEGYDIRTATVEFMGETYEETKTVVIPATGHDYDPANAIAEWADDGSACLFILVCTKCSADTEGNSITVPADTITSEMVGDSIVYTATLEYNGRIYTSTKTIAVNLPYIAVPTVKDSDLLYGFEVDLINNIIYLDTLAGGISSADLAYLLSDTVVVNDADNKVDLEINGTVFSEGKELVPTGATITFTAENSNGTKASATYHVVVIGDVNGNGYIENNDAVFMTQHYLNVKEIVDMLALAAADTNRNGRIDNADIVRNTQKYVSPDQYTTLLD